MLLKHNNLENVLQSYSNYIMLSNSNCWGLYPSTKWTLLNWPQNSILDSVNKVNLLPIMKKCIERSFFRFNSSEPPCSQMFLQICLPECTPCVIYWLAGLHFDSLVVFPYKFSLYISTLPQTDWILHPLACFNWIRGFNLSFPLLSCFEFLAFSSLQIPGHIRWLV